MAEIDLDAVLALSETTARYRPIPRVPAVSRDLSVVLAGGMPFGRLVERIEAVEPPAPAEFTVVDRYVGEPLGEGEVSLTVRVILQPLERTLTDDVVEAYRRDLVAAIEADEGIRMRG
jgi:phenylalanyl-tRNA synthetase beta chain